MGMRRERGRDRATTIAMVTTYWQHEASQGDPGSLATGNWQVVLVVNGNHIEMSA